MREQDWIITPQDLTPEALKNAAEKLRVDYEKIKQQLTKNAAAALSGDKGVEDSYRISPQKAVEKLLYQIKTDANAPEEFQNYYLGRFWDNAPENAETGTHGKLKLPTRARSQQLFGYETCKHLPALLEITGYEGSFWQDVLRVNQQCASLRRIMGKESLNEWLENPEESIKLANKSVLTQQGRELLAEWKIAHYQKRDFAEESIHEFERRSWLYECIDAVVKEEFPEEEFDAAELAIKSVVARERLMTEKALILPYSLDLDYYSFPKADDYFCELGTDFNFICEKSSFFNVAAPLTRPSLAIHDTALTHFSRTLFRQLRSIFAESGHDATVHNLVYPAYENNFHTKYGDHVARSILAPLFKDKKTLGDEIALLDACYDHTSSLRNWGNIRLKRIFPYEEFALVAGSLIQRKAFELYPALKEETLQKATKFMQQLNKESQALLKKGALTQAQVAQQTGYLATTYMEYLTLLPFTRQELETLAEAVNQLPITPHPYDFTRLQKQFEQNDILKEKGDFSVWQKAITQNDTSVVHEKWQNHVGYYHELQKAGETLQSPFNNILFTLYSNGAGRQLWMHRGNEIERGAERQNIPAIFLAAYKVCQKFKSPDFMENLAVIASAANRPSQSR